MISLKNSQPLTPISKVKGLFPAIACLGLSCLLVGSAVAWPQADPGDYGAGDYGAGGSGSGTPPLGTHEKLTRVTLQAHIVTAMPITHICSNIQFGCPPCIVNDSAWSLGGGRIVPLGQIVPHSGGAGGGEAQNSTLMTLRSGASSGGSANGNWGAPSQSYVNTSSFHHNHVAKDFALPMPSSAGSNRGPHTASLAPTGTSESCSLCGTDPDIPENGGQVPYISLARQHRGRDMTEMSSFGPGWFSPYDMKVHLNSDEIGNVDIFDPSDATPRRFEFYGNGGDYGGGDYGGGDYGGGDYGGNGVFESESHGVIKKLSMLDASGNPVPNRANASKVVIENWSGNQFEFEVFLQEQVVGGTGDSGGGNYGSGDYGDGDYGDGDYDGGSYSAGSVSDSTDNDLYEARLVQIRNRDGQSLDIAYKTFTEAEYAVSPERHWQIDTVTDSSQQSISFDYGTTQVGGRWVVEQIHLPGNKTIDFDYASDKLSKVTRPDGSESNFTTSFDSSIQHVVMDFDDPAAVETTDRDKEVWTTSNFVERAGSAGSQTGFFNQASQLTRAIIDSNDDVAFAQISQGSGTGQQWVYEGGGVLKRTYNGIESRYATAWELTSDSSGQMSVNATYEDTYATARSTHGNYMGGTPIAIVDKAGIRRDFKYDSDGFVNEIQFGDYSKELVTYNDNHQVVRFTDRDGHVEKYTYDAQGHRLTKEVGLIGVTSDPGNPYVWPPVPPTYQDTVQPEHAVYQWEYYPTGHANEGQLKTEFDPSWDGSSLDTHRKDYEYDSVGRVTKVLESASVSGGDRPEWNYTYANSLVSSIVNPSGHTTSYEYDINNRLVRTTFDDGSTEERLYGSPNTADEGFVVRTKDRRDVVTAYTYDGLGRVTQVVVAVATDANILDGNPDDNLTTDRNQQSISTMTYNVGVTSPATVVRDGSRTDYVYDYRGRAIETKVYPYANKTLSTKVVYRGNQKVSDEDPYGRKTYYGYRASDGAMVRVIKVAYPSFVPGQSSGIGDYGDGDYGGGDYGGSGGGTNDVVSNQTILTLTRDTNLNPAFTIKDIVQDLSGNEVSVIDERGVTHTSEYNTRGQVIRKKKAMGTPVEAITEMDYDEDGNVLEIRSPRYFDSTDTNGYQKCKTVMTYDGQGRVLTSTEAPGTPEAATESYAYDSEGRQVTRTDARGKVWTTTYATCCGHSVSSKNPLGHGSISNKDNGGLVTHTAGIGDVDTHTTLLDPIDAKTLRETTTRYDALGRSIAACTWLVPQGIIDPESPPMAGFDGISGQDGLTSQTLYDADLTDGIGLDSTAGVTVTNPLGGTFTVSLSAALTKMAEPIAQGGASTSFNADASGSAVVNLNAENEVSFNISDAEGRTIISGIQHPHDPLPGNTHGDLLTWSCQVHDTTEQLSNGETVLTSINVDALGHTTKARSNAFGHTLETIDQLNFSSTVKYDAAGNAIETRDPNNTGYDMVYDNLNRNISQADMVGSQTQSLYDRSGQQVQAIDAKNKATTYVYDARGHRITEIDRLNYATNWTYDASGNLLSLTDAENQTTSYTYNDAGQHITEEYPDHIAGAVIGNAGYGMITFSYDSLGRRTVKEDQTGDTTSYSFDMSGRMFTRVYVGHPTSPLAGQTDTDTFTYDRNGRMLSATKGRYNNTVSFSYDDRGEQIQDTLTTHGQTYTVGHQKDELGQTTQLQYPDGSLVDRAYTNRSQLLSIKYTPNGGIQSDVANFDYDAGGRETTRNLDNGLTTSRSYFADNQLQSIVTPTVESFSYNYDSNKNPTGESRSGVMAPYSWSTGQSGIDDEDRLTSWSRTNGESQLWSLSTVHEWENTTINGSLQTRSHGPAHEILSMSGAGVSNSPQALTYDAKGNVTTNSRGSGISWDFDNQMVTFSNTETYTYDAIGRRVSRTVDQTGSNVETRIYSYAGRQCVFVEDPNLPGGFKATYCWAQYIDDLVMCRFGLATNLETLFMHTDRRFSITSSSNLNAQTQRRYAYSATGKRYITNSGGAVSAFDSSKDVPYGYTGRVHDDESHLIYFRTRYLSCDTGGFLSRDPIQYLDGNNLYTAYFASRSVDPSGAVSPQCFGCVIGGGVGVILSIRDDFEDDALDGCESTVRGAWNGFMGCIGGVLAVSVPGTSLKMTDLLRKFGGKNGAKLANFLWQKGGKNLRWVSGGVMIGGVFYSAEALDDLIAGWVCQGNKERTRQNERCVEQCGRVYDWLWDYSFYNDCVSRCDRRHPSF